MKFDFGDNTFSTITVDSSGRSGTFSRLHITEFAQVVKNFPDKAKEILDESKKKKLDYQDRKKKS